MGFEIVFHFASRIRRTNKELEEWIEARRSVFVDARALAPEGARHFGFQQAADGEGIIWNLDLYRDFFFYATALDVEQPTQQEIAKRALFLQRLTKGHKHRKHAQRNLIRLQTLITTTLREKKTRTTAPLPPGAKRTRNHKRKTVDPSGKVI